MENDMKLTRKQELALIDLGLHQLLKTIEGGRGNYIHTIGKKRGPYKTGPENKGTHGKKWTEKQRRKFSETMKKKWANKEK